jgi:hypothetical protein
LSSVTKLTDLTPGKFDAWFDNVRDCLSLAGNATLAQQATMIRLTVDEPIRELLKNLTDAQRDDPDALFAFLRRAAHPNRDADRFQVMKKILGWTQGGKDHASYIFGHERYINKATAGGLNVDLNLRAFLLLQGLSQNGQRDIILSQNAGMDYERVCASIMGLTAGRTTRSSRGERGYGADEKPLADDSEEKMPDLEDDDEEDEDFDINDNEDEANWIKGPRKGPPRKPGPKRGKGFNRRGPSKPRPKSSMSTSPDTGFKTKKKFDKTKMKCFNWKRARAKFNSSNRNFSTFPKSGF